MPVTMPRVMLMACLLSPSLSWALGLGEIHLNSALNEPMNADIDLIAAAPDELTALRASLANRDTFTRYGIDRPSFLSSLTFKVGKGKDGRDALLVRSTDAIPEPFVTFLVEVNWARGRLMREYTVLLDPPVYTPGEAAKSAAPVAAATIAPPPVRRSPPPAAAPVGAAPQYTSPSAAPSARTSTLPNTVHVGRGDTLSKIASGLAGRGSSADLDQTMIALYRTNPEAFGGNINILRQGAVLRVPNADEIAALNQREAVGEVHRQMDAWHGGEAGNGESNGHLRLVAPTAGGSATGTRTAASPNANGATAGGNTDALKDRVKDLEGQLAESKRLIDIRNGELSALQRKLAAPAPAPAPAPTPAPAMLAPVVPAPVAAPPPAATQPPASPPSVATPPPGTPSATSPGVVAPIPVPVPAAPHKATVTPADSGSWIDWVVANWWVPLALLVAVLAGLVFAAMKRRRTEDDGVSSWMEETGVADARDPASTSSATRRNEAFVVEETGQHPVPDFAAEPVGLGDTGEMKSPDDTLSSETAVNLDQGDPLAEADFHMAYGLYDQAADLVRIALEREPDRRDLRLKLLEIYFVWGNKDAFLQAAKGLEATRERAPAGEWDKILIMGKQICPDEPLFAAGGGRGAGSVVDLNLEGGENRVDIDLFGDVEGERSALDSHVAEESSHEAAHAEATAKPTGSDLDFTLDAPERGADESPTREMPARDEPTVESELMGFGDAWHDTPTTESPTLRNADMRDRIASMLPTAADQTAEVSLDDLGLNLDALEETGSLSASGISHLDPLDHPTGDHPTGDHPGDAPTLVAGLDERTRRMMEEAHKHASEGDLTEIERELEASFVTNTDKQESPESAPTVLMRRDIDESPTTRFSALEAADSIDAPKDVDSTSRLRELHSDSIDLDLDRMASALGSDDTVEEPPAEEDLFSSEVFEGTLRSKRVDLDVGEPMDGTDAPTNKLLAQTNKLKPIDLSATEMEPVTMSEVGTKLDLARAYMDMGDPEGARSILEEVVQEGSASQKQEASRLIESLPG